MPATLLRAQLSDEELLRHEPTRSAAAPCPTRPALPGFVVAIREIEAGLRSASQLEWVRWLAALAAQSGIAGRQCRKKTCPTSSPRLRTPTLSKMAVRCSWTV